MHFSDSRTSPPVAQVLAAYLSRLGLGFTVLLVTGCPRHTPAPMAKPPPVETPVVSPTPELPKPSLMTLLPDGERCRLAEIRTGAMDASSTVATFPMPCPQNWRIAAHSEERRWLVTLGSFSNFHAFEVNLDTGDVLAIDPPPGELEAAIWRDGEVAVVTSGPEEPESDEESGEAWIVVDGIRTEIDSYGGAVPCREWQNLDGAWAQQSLRIEELHEGMQSPWCVDMDDLVVPGHEHDFGSSGPEQSFPEEADLVALESYALPDSLADGWQWVGELSMAYRTYWFEGQMTFTPAVRWDGAAWHVIDGLGGKDEQLEIYVREGIALACTSKGAHVYRLPDWTNLWNQEGACPVWKD